MSAAIPDLWSDDIRVDVLTPLAILKTQEGILAKKTHGILEAQVTTNYTQKLVQHDLDLIAPALGYYRERILSATHGQDRVYPVTITAESFRPPRKFVGSLGELAPNQKIAETEEAFISLVRDVLQSGEVRGLIQSLIARSNENRPPQVPPASQPPGDGNSGKEK